MPEFKGPDPGELRRRITIEEVERTQDSYGEDQKEWTEVASRRAKIEDLAGNLVTEGPEPQALSAARLTFRYYRGLSPTTHRLVDPDGATLNIQEITNPDGRKRWHVVTAVRVL